MRSMREAGLRQCAGALMAALLWLAAPACAHAAFDPALLQRIDRFVADEVAASHIPGVALAVLDDGRVVHSRGFGDDGRGHAVSADTPFPIGSLTKSFTALLVRQFIEAGQLDARRRAPHASTPHASSKACRRRCSASSARRCATAHR
mgnify:CR=1 FL=1